MSWATNCRAAAEAGRYLRLVELVPTDFVGTPRREARDFRAAQEPFEPAVNGELSWLRTSAALREPVRQYLSLAVDCATLARQNRASPLAGDPSDPWTGSPRARNLPPDTPPLVAYRAAVCDAVARNTLERLKTVVPQFIEINYFLARLEVVAAVALGSSANSLNIEIGASNTRAQALLAEALGRFPESASLNYLSGNSSQLAGDCGAAVDFYGKTLAIKSRHEDALLSRTTCLSFLKRHDEAIDTATRMIDLRTDNWGDAYYWRAWNLHAKTQLEPARADVERAKTLAPSGQTLTLAGVIEHDQDALAVAESDLRRAKAMDRQNRNCVAMWYLALVKLKQEQWLDSAGYFEQAMTCYAANVQDDELRLQAMQARTDLDADFKARHVAGLEAALKEDRSQHYAAAFNAANQFAHGGNIDKARLLIEVAAQDPALAEKVGQLRDIIK